MNQQSEGLQLETTEALESLLKSVNDRARINSLEERSSIGNAAIEFIRNHGATFLIALSDHRRMNVIENLDVKFLEVQVAVEIIGDQPINSIRELVDRAEHFARENPDFEPADEDVQEH